MKVQRSRLVFFLVSVLTVGWAAWTARAEAGSIRIVAGTLRQKDDRAGVRRALAGLQGDLAVCWRGKRPETVTVKLVVGPGGDVISSRQVTRAPVAQCVAGVLAVQTLPATGSRYQVSVELGTATDTGGAIQAALAPHRARLMACRKRSKAGVSGRVVLRFAIEPSGRVVDPAVKSSQLGNATVERCLVQQLAQLQLGPGVTGNRVNYSLSLDFARTRGSGGAAADTREVEVALPRKDGPLPGREISAVMTRRKADFSACYDRRARRDRSLAGRVVLRFTIRDDGTVRNVKIRETTLNNSKVQNCIVKVGKTLRFPAEPGRGAVRVWFPFVFSPQ